MKPDEDRDRFVAAACLRSRGYLPTPSRFSRSHHPRTSWVLWESMLDLNPVRDRNTIVGLAGKAFSGFLHPCDIELVTGAVSSTIAISTRNDSALLWMFANLPETPAVLDGPGEPTTLLYRHPGGAAADCCAYIEGLVGPPAAVLHVHGEWSPITVPVSAYRSVVRWPAVSELPVFDRAWIPMQWTADHFMQRKWPCAGRPEGCPLALTERSEGEAGK